MKTYLILFLAALIAPFTNFAALFDQGGVSASAISTAFANTGAGVDDITLQYYNPAATTYHYHHEVAFVPRYLFPIDSFNHGQSKNILGTTLTGSTANNNISQNQFGGALFGILAPSDHLRFNMAVTTPWQMHNSYPADWVGRYYSTLMQIESVNLNPSVAYSFQDFLSFAAGAQFQYLDFRYQHAIDFGLLGAALGIAGAEPSLQDGIELIDTNGWGWGWNVGVILKACWNVRLGCGYRSEVVHHLTATPKYEFGAVGEKVASALHSYTNVDANFQLTCPASYWGGIHYHFNQQWQFTGAYIYKKWSDNETLDFKYTNQHQPFNTFNLGWKDSTSIALGVKYSPARCNWTMRAGGQFEQNPVGHQLPMFFANDTYKISMGWQWCITPCMRIDVGYLYGFVRSINLDQKASQIENTFRGDLSGTINSNTNEIVAQLIAYF